MDFKNCKIFLRNYPHLQKGDEAPSSPFCFLRFPFLYFSRHRYDDIFARPYVRCFQPVHLTNCINHLFGFLSLCFIFLRDIPNRIAPLNLHRLIIRFCFSSLLRAHGKGSQAENQRQCQQQKYVFSDFSGFPYDPSLCSSFHAFAPIHSEHFFVLCLYITRTSIPCQYFFAFFANIGLILYQFHAIMKNNIGNCRSSGDFRSSAGYFCHRLDNSHLFGYNHKE